MFKLAVITVVVNKKGQILLLKRPSDHKFPNQWCFPGGKVDFLSDHEIPSAWRWETPVEAALRETFEETGIRIKLVMDSNIFVADDSFAVSVFTAKFDDYVVTKEFPNREHVEYMWYTPQMIDTDNFIYDLPEGCGPMTTDVLHNVAIPMSVQQKRINQSIYL